VDLPAGRQVKEGENAVNWRRLSCHDFVDNQVRLQLFALAYNLGNFLRRLALPRSVKHWSLTTLREKLVKTDHLPRSATDARAPAVLARITARGRLDTPSIAQRECLRISQSAIESLERSTAVVGRQSRGECRVEP